MPEHAELVVDCGPESRGTQAELIVLEGAALESVLLGQEQAQEALRAAQRREQAVLRLRERARSDPLAADILEALGLG